MTSDGLVCDSCFNEIIQYYDESYKGNRGKCPICGMNFPLE